MIHHLDWDKTHNTVENLICLTVYEHEIVHNIIGGEKGKALGYEMLKNRVDGLPPDAYSLHQFRIYDRPVVLLIV